MNSHSHRKSDAMQVLDRYANLRERFQVDHKAKEIIPKADIPSPRKEFSACAIGCKVYVTGGRGSENGVSKDVWIYDTVHEEWSKGAPMLIAR